ncbi:MAG: hypothetical protein V7L29_24295, partial [Nostoc sp.]|uniref:hypothetical protein n=1 Tax=Nostoc sp. TaxID=1180 RepID=UPI002FF82036
HRILITVPYMLRCFLNPLPVSISRLNGKSQMLPLCSCCFVNTRRNVSLRQEMLKYWLNIWKQAREASSGPLPLI